MLERRAAYVRLSKDNMLLWFWEIDIISAIKYHNWERQGFIMKANRIAGRCILAGVFVYLMFQIFYLACDLLPLSAEKNWRGIICLFLAQSILLEVILLAVFILSFWQYRKEKLTSPFAAFAVVSGEGRIINEVVLRNKRSLMITGGKRGKEVFVESASEVNPDRYLYAVCNLISGCWYIEANSGSRSIGLRRGSGDVIYRLKAGIPYPLSESDIIYADTCKIIVRQQKFLEGSKWV